MRWLIYAWCSVMWPAVLVWNTCVCISHCVQCVYDESSTARWWQWLVLYCPASYRPLLFSTTLSMHCRKQAAHKPIPLPHDGCVPCMCSMCQNFLTLLVSIEAVYACICLCVCVCVFMSLDVGSMVLDHRIFYAAPRVPSKGCEYDMQLHMSFTTTIEVNLIAQFLDIVQVSEWVLVGLAGQILGMCMCMLPQQLTCTSTLNICKCDWHVRSNTLSLTQMHSAIECLV